jgi:hypothetical protein
MRGVFGFVTDLWRMWSRGASALIVAAIGVAAFGLIAFLIAAFAVWLFSFGGDPGDTLQAAEVDWWKASAFLWGPVGVGFALPHIAEMAAEWAAEDEERTLEQA